MAFLDLAQILLFVRTEETIPGPGAHFYVIQNVTFVVMEVLFFCCLSLCCCKGSGLWASEELGEIC